MEKKKKLKGMTLMEIVVAMAVMLVISVMIIVGCESAVYNTRIAKTVSDKSREQAPYAATQVIDTSEHKVNIALSGDVNGTIVMDSYVVDKGTSPLTDRSGDYRYFCK